MVVLCEIKLAGGRDLGGDRAITLGRQSFFVGGLRLPCGAQLRIAIGIDRRAILRADIVALAHALRWIVAFPERLQQRVI